MQRGKPGQSNYCYWVNRIKIAHNAFPLRGCFSLELHFSTVNFSPLTILFEEDNSIIYVQNVFWLWPLMKSQGIGWKQLCHCMYSILNVLKPWLWICLTNENLLLEKVLWYKLTQHIAHLSLFFMNVYMFIYREIKISCYIKKSTGVTRYWYYLSCKEFISIF